MTVAVVEQPQVGSVLIAAGTIVRSYGEGSGAAQHGQLGLLVLVEEGPGLCCDARIEVRV